MAESPQTPAASSGRSPGLAPVLTFFAAVLVYLPSLRGEFIWNDPDYVTKPALTSLRGLWRIWTELGATEQYYPLLHSFFWIQQRVFHYDPLWYHAVNVLLHAACAALLVLVVKRLFEPEVLRIGGPEDQRIRGSDSRSSGLLILRPSDPPVASSAIALLAGLIFAVHPVYVESVAWISEQKNTFSLLWYLLAGLVYLRYLEAVAGVPSPGDRSPGEGTRTTTHPFWRHPAYWLATFFFLLAILSKSVTATLPCALMVLAWWRTGRLERSTWVPLVPWIVCGAAMGGLTGWVEHHIIGAYGDDFALGVIERGVLAGRVIWFYLGKYAWPANLIFIYPHWTVDTGLWWQWLFPVAAIGLLVVLWRIRGRARGPLAGYLIFVGSLVPTIGFFNVYAFKFSYVADHWNYLPSLALAVMAAWGAVALAERFEGRAGRFDKLKAPSLPRGSPSRPGLKDRGRAEAVPQPGSKSAIAAEAPPQPYPQSSEVADPASQPYLKITAGAVLLLLAALSVWQIRGYQNLEVFYQTILRQNPDCWLAAHNLGGIRQKAGRPAEAVPYYEQALRARPQLTEALNDLGGVLQRMGRRAEAIARYEQAVHWAPDDPDFHRNLGASLASVGRLDEAVAQLRRAVELKPAAPDIHRLLAQALFESGRTAEAQAERAEADRLQNQH